MSRAVEQVHLHELQRLFIPRVWWSQLAILVENAALYVNNVMLPYSKHTCTAILRTDLLVAILSSHPENYLSLQARPNLERKLFSMFSLIILFIFRFMGQLVHGPRVSWLKLISCYFPVSGSFQPLSLPWLSWNHLRKKHELRESRLHLTPLPSKEQLVVHTSSLYPPRLKTTSPHKPAQGQWSHGL